MRNIIDRHLILNGNHSLKHHCIAFWERRTRDCLISVGMWYCFCGFQSNLLSWYPLLVSMVIKALQSLKCNQNNDERHQNLQLPPRKTYCIDMLASSVDVLIPSSRGDNYICTKAVASSTIPKSTSAVNATEKYFSTSSTIEEITSAHVH